MDYLIINYNVKDLVKLNIFYYYKEQVNILF